MNKGKNSKIFKIKKVSQRGNETITEGTIEYLSNYFSYTLEIGNSYNKRINRTPKTIKSFMKNLQNAYHEKECGCFSRTYVELIEN